MTFTYKNYSTEVKVKQDGSVHGVIKLGNYDNAFKGKTVEEAKKEFQAVIEAYLAFREDFLDIEDY